MTGLRLLVKCECSASFSRLFVAGTALSEGFVRFSIVAKSRIWYAGQLKDSVWIVLSHGR
jgi:hypothetical protein